MGEVLRTRHRDDNHQKWTVSVFYLPLPGCCSNLSLLFLLPSPHGTWILILHELAVSEQHFSKLFVLSQVLSSSKAALTPLSHHSVTVSFLQGEGRRLLLIRIMRAVKVLITVASICEICFPTIPAQKAHFTHSPDCLAMTASTSRP